MLSNLWLGSALIALTCTGCFGATTAEQRYYALSLPAPTEPQRQPPNRELLLHEVEISPVYNRPEIVYRISPQELRFFHQSNWADRPSRMIGQLLLKALGDAGIFRSVVDRLGTHVPAYALDTSVTALEEMQGGDQWFAHFAMTVRLSRFEDNRMIWQYSFDQRRPLNTQDLGLVVRAMSEILAEQMRVMLPQIDAVLAGRPLPPPPQPLAEVVTPSQASVVPPTPHPVKAPELAVFDGTNGTYVDWHKSAQYASDPVSLPASKGAIFLPSLSLKPDREPPVSVMRGGHVVATGTSGHRIAVPPGHYQVLFGSGPTVQQLSRNIEVIEGEVAVVSPDWAALDVSVVSSKFVSFLGTYELIRMDDREYMGVGYGVDEELGQQTLVWILKPGLYKFVQSGSNYRARTNFSTVLLIPGMAVQFVLVQDETTRDFLGAGVAEADPDRRADGSRGRGNPWKFRSSLGGSVLLANRTEGYSSSPVGSSLALDLFADSRLQYIADPHLWTTRLEVEEGQMFQSAVGSNGSLPSIFRGRLQSVRDRVYLNSIYIYSYLPWVGPYVRVGGETGLFAQNAYFETPTTVHVLDTAGHESATYAGSDGKGETRFALSGPLMPIQLKEGAGANFRVLHATNIDLSLRSGLGSRQYFARGQLVSKDNPATPGFEVQQVASTFQTGLELSALSQVRLTRFLQASTEFDSLLPFSGLANTQLTWRSSISLRLSGFAALTYALNVVRQPNVRPDQPFATEQGLQLRFSYAPW